MDDVNARRARSFGQVAQEYDRWRPDYPAALYDDLLGLTEGRRVLEAGAGTGRATLALAERGAEVVAVEPDPQMAQVARRRTRGRPVEIVVSAFEDVDVDPASYDLVVSAQAWHWVDPVTGAAVARRALRPGGVVALWWNRPGDLIGPVWDAVRRAYLEHAPDLVDTAVAMNWPPSDEMTRTTPWEGFGQWSHVGYAWVRSYDSTSYTGLVQTHSDHLLLPADQRAALIAGVAAAIRDAGGDRIDYPYRTVLVHTRKDG